MIKYQIFLFLSYLISIIACTENINENVDLIESANQHILKKITNSSDHSEAEERFSLR